MKRVILLSLLPFLCTVTVHATTLGEAMSERGRLKRSLKERVSICEYYIMGVAEVEKAASGKTSDMIQRGLELIESGKGRYSELCGIMDAHKMLLDTQSVTLNIRLLEAKRESSWIEEAQITHGGEAKVRLKDGTRVDLLTDTHAIEVEHADNWRDAIGQSLHYARLTDKKAGIILISIPGDANYTRSLGYVKSLNEIIDSYNLPIDILFATR